MVLEAGILNEQHLSGGDIAGKKYTHICVGTDDSPVVGTETDLTGAFNKAITSVSYQSGGITVFSTTLADTDPAMTIKEIGLKNQDGVLLYRKVIAPRAKVLGSPLVIIYRKKTS